MCLLENNRLMIDTDYRIYVFQGKKLGDWFVWGKSPRARIFERDHHTVTDLDSLTKLMR